MCSWIKWVLNYLKLLMFVQVLKPFFSFCADYLEGYLPTRRTTYTQDVMLLQLHGWCTCNRIPKVNFEQDIQTIHHFLYTILFRDVKNGVAWVDHNKTSVDISAQVVSGSKIWRQLPR